MDWIQTDGRNINSVPLVNGRFAGVPCNVDFGRNTMLYGYSDSGRSHMYEGGDVLFSTGKINGEQIMIG